MKGCKIQKGVPDSKNIGFKRLFWNREEKFPPICLPHLPKTLVFSRNLVIAHVGLHQDQIMKFQRKMVDVWRTVKENA